MTFGIVPVCMYLTSSTLVPEGDAKAIEIFLILLVHPGHWALPISLGGNRFVRPCAPYTFLAPLKSWTARKVIWFKECGCTGMEIEAGPGK